MAGKTKIEWATDSWNPVRGCSIVSKGCTNCYAMRQAHRSSGAGGAYEGLTKLSKGGPVWTGAIRTVPELLDQPLRWRRPRRIFVNSMSDLFHDDVPDGFLLTALMVMANAHQHTFQVLTKRPERMQRFMSELVWIHGGPAIANVGGRNHLFVHIAMRKEDFDASVGDGHIKLGEPGSAMPDPWKVPPNLWLGVSVEDQPTADARLRLLRQTPAAVRFVSAEPLLGPIDADLVDCMGAPTGDIHWLIAGGESGPGARPSHPDWFRSLRDQCAAARVPFFFKQWGSHLVGEIRRTESIVRWQNGREQWWGDHLDIKHSEHWLSNEDGRVVIAAPSAKKTAGRQLDGRTHDEYPA